MSFPSRLQKFQFGAAYSVFWMGTAFVMAWRSVANHALMGDPLTYKQALVVAGFSCLFWMCTLPIVVWLSFRCPLTREPWPIGLLAHLTFSLLFVLLSVASRMALDYAVPSLRRLSGDSFRVFQVYFFSTLGRSLLLYGGVVAWAHAWRFFRDYQNQHETTAQLRERVAELVRDDSHPSDSPYVQRFLMKERGRVFAVGVEHVDWIEAAGNYVSLHVGSQTHLLRESMRTMEQRLDPGRFMRIHRSAIVRVSFVREVRTLGGGRYGAMLQNGHTVPVGQPGIDRLDVLISQSRPAPSH